MSENLHSSALQELVYGVYILGMQVGDLTHGMTASWVEQVSTDPPLVCAAIAKSARGNEFLRQTGVFSLSMLDESEESIARHFAGEPPGEGEPPAVVFETESCGGPILDGCRAWLQCVLMDVYSPPGDHDLFIAQVTSSGVAEDIAARPALVLNRTSLPRHGLG